MKAKIIFKETQKFTQWWLWVLMILPLVLVVFQVLSPLFNETAYASGNLSFSIVAPTGFWIGVLVWFLTIGFIFFSKLKTTITQEQVSIRHLLFVKKKIAVKDIAKVDIVKYGFVGYGLRLSKNYGTVYNVKGNNGLAITLNNGNKYLIGTQKPAELETVIKKIWE